MSRYQKAITALDREMAAVNEDEWRCGEPVVGPRGPRAPMVPCVLERGHSGWHSSSEGGITEGKPGTRSAALRDAWRVCYEDRQGREGCVVVHAEHKGAALRAFMVNHRGKFRRVVSVT